MKKNNSPIPETSEWKKTIKFFNVELPFQCLVCILLSLPISLAIWYFIIINPIVNDYIKERVQIYVVATVNSMSTLAQVATYTPYPTNTVYPTQTSYPTNTPYPTYTYFPNDTITPTTSNILPKGEKCFSTKYWRPFNRENIPLKQVGDEECYDLSDQDIFDFTNEQGYHTIKITSSKRFPGMQGLSRIDESLNWEQKLNVRINNINSGKKCSKDEICDVSFIIGVGNPVSKGFFLMFRSVSNDSDLLICDLENIYKSCNQPIIRLPTHLLPMEYEITVKRSFNEVNLIIGDKKYSVQNIRYLENPFLWIGYNFSDCQVIWI